uniref:uncharacterized protein LOC122596313 n=1 Tax=Erigeron canadensis TaxID=72917 RepID=UPI001CB93C60|nr:uncharacterized protein LOC122596313 [Erigeron canadensis]
MSKRLRSTTQNHNHDDDHDDNIPVDIQTEIIKRVQDVKPLIRCRSVSKAWKSLIDSSKFIADHYKSNTNNHCMLVNYYEKKVNKYMASVVDDDDDDSFPRRNLPVALPESIDTSRLFNSEQGNLIGMCHGLFCFYGREEKVVDNSSSGKVAVIWNPSIRKSVAIPFPDKYHSLAAINFSVCPCTMHPKLVCIRPAENLADIYTLSSSSGDNYWTSVSINLPNISHISFFSEWAAHKAALDEGILYWHVYNNFNDHGHRFNRIITFDLASEEFGEVCLPDCLATTDLGHVLYLSCKPNGSSLVVIARDTQALYRVGKAVSHVWRMEEHGLFKQLYTIEAPGYYFVRGFRINGQAIIANSTLKILQVYDPSNRQIKDLDFNHIGHRVFFMGCYRKTLLLLNHQSISSFIGD